MIEIDITEDMVAKAFRKAKEMGELRQSITRGDGNLAGFIGEQVVWQILGGEWANTYDYDIIAKDGSTVDVKTKRTGVTPLPHYDCSVSGLNAKQKCDKYAFVRILNNNTKAWYLGTIDKDVFYENATFIKKGEVDPSNNFKAKSDMYNLTIAKLKELA
jgi:hypothetical protein